MPGEIRPFAGAAERALSEAEFETWWRSSVSPEDRAEYIHLHQGNLEGARMLCVLDYFISTLHTQRTDDVIVQAYCIAVRAPLADVRSPKIRMEAQALYEDEAVQMLWDRLRTREIQDAEVRIERKLAKQIENLLDRADEGVLEPLEQRTALGEANKYIATRQKIAEGARNRRAQRAVATVIKTSAERKDGVLAPPSIEEAKEFMKMVISLHGADALSDIIQDAIPKALTSEETLDETPTDGGTPDVPAAPDPS